VLAILLYLSLGPRAALAEISAEILIGLSLRAAGKASASSAPWGCCWSRCGHAD